MLITRCKKKRAIYLSACTQTGSSGTIFGPRETEFWQDLERGTKKKCLEYKFEPFEILEVFFPYYTTSEFVVVSAYVLHSRHDAH